MTRRGGAEPWLVTGGILMMLVGVALVVLPTLLPDHAWVFRSLAARGVTSLPIAIGGVLLCGIALASRSSGRTPAPSADTSRENSAALDALALQIATLGDNLQGIRIEFVYLKDALQSQLERVQAATSSAGAGDAVYRLAASLDQVGLRIEERINAGNRDLGESFRVLSTTLEGLREDHGKLRAELGAVATAAATAAGAAAASAAAASAKSEMVEEEVEAYADGWTPDQEKPSTHPDRLGLLDMLDDLGRLLPSKTVREPEAALELDLFEGSQDEGWKQAGSIPAALPSYREDERHLAERGRLLGHGFRHPLDTEPEGVLGDKLSELRDLLADARVREALAALEKGRGGNR